MLKNKNILYALTGLIVISGKAYSTTVKNPKEAIANVMVHYKGPDYKSLDLGYFKNAQIEFKDHTDPDEKKYHLDLSNSKDEKQLLGTYPFDSNAGPFRLIGKPTEPSDQGVALECMNYHYGTTIPVMNERGVLKSLVLNTSLSYDPEKKQDAGSCTIEDLVYGEPR